MHQKLNSGKEGDNDVDNSAFHVKGLEPPSSELLSFPSNLIFSEEKKCRQVGKCEQCTTSEQKEYEACYETGRWVKFECTLEKTDIAGDTTEIEDIDTNTESK